ncbi:hypothetical protein [Paenibacillus sp. FSL H7-0331]|uniref:hypothetical protein n=1 Tax=Paenibacillus sp. FSL H7-0331 TaxID=1920421 RepID=UPI00096FEBFA|nr:hypothetical protein [Paenibacillus sp. FSL H7-0331]OMF14828.1 hypothetical protein BK127_16575 [Paenibacillus sp. FSL H7-0331]
MQVSFSSRAITQSPYAGIKAIDSSMSIKKADKADSVSISEGARNMFAKNDTFKKNAMIEALMKQKENLLENKNKLVEKTLKDGGQLDTIKDQIKELDQQLRLLDQQISQQQIDDQQKALGLDEESKKPTKAVAAETKTDNEVQAEQLHNIASLAGNLDQIERMSAQKNNMQGETRILKNEIKADEARSLSNLPATGKREKLSNLNKGISDIEKRIGEMTQSTTEKLKEVNKPSDDNIAEETPVNGSMDKSTELGNKR